MRVYAGRRFGRRYYGGVSFPGWSLLWILLWLPLVVVWGALAVLASNAAPFWKLLAGLFLAMCIYEFVKWFATTP